MLEASKVGGGVSTVKSLIKGICTVVLRPVTLHIRRDVSLDHCLGEETRSGSNIGYKYR